MSQWPKIMVTDTVVISDADEGHVYHPECAEKQFGCFACGRCPKCGGHLFKIGEKSKFSNSPSWQCGKCHWDENSLTDEPRLYPDEMNHFDSEHAFEGPLTCFKCNLPIDEAHLSISRSARRNERMKKLANLVEAQGNFAEVDWEGYPLGSEQRIARWLKSQLEKPLHGHNRPHMKALLNALEHFVQEYRSKKKS